MPAAPKKSDKTGDEPTATEEEQAAQLSALLKKGHDARMKALLKDGCPIAEHIKREAERAGLDPSMLLAIYLGVVAHALNPCARFPIFRPWNPTMPAFLLLTPPRFVMLAGKARYRQNKKLAHDTYVLLWILVLGDSGVGKSKGAPPRLARASFHCARARALTRVSHLFSLRPAQSRSRR